MRSNRFIDPRKETRIAKNPAVLVEIQDLVDAAQEAMNAGNERRIREIQEELARKYDQIAAAQSLERNGMTRYTMALIRRLGYRVVAL